MEIIIGIFIFALGLIIGSFLNVCILRIPEERSIVAGSSSCMDCGAKLTAVDLVPLFSYLFLRGKCRHCGKKISPIYPIVESLTGVLFLLLYIKFGLFYPPTLLSIFSFVIYMAFIAILIVISFIDYRHMIIPNGLIIALLILGVVQIAITLITGDFKSWIACVIGFFAGGVPLLLIALFCEYVLKKEAFGGGDVKLMAAAGFLTGWKLTITSYLIGIILGAIVGVILLASGKKKRGDQIPFGPFLAIGIAASIFFGDVLINWYLGLF
jgi:leader peptidase (prepilin peptidase) / N-methyltransferase